MNKKKFDFEAAFAQVFKCEVVVKVKRLQEHEIESFGWRSRRNVKRKHESLNFDKVNDDLFFNMACEDLYSGVQRRKRKRIREELMEDPCDTSNDVIKTEEGKTESSSVELKSLDIAKSPDQHPADVEKSQHNVNQGKPALPTPCQSINLMDTEDIEGNTTLPVFSKQNSGGTELSPLLPVVPKLRVKTAAELGMRFAFIDDSTKSPTKSKFDLKLIVQLYKKYFTPVYQEKIRNIADILQKMDKTIEEGHAKINELNSSKHSDAEKLLMRYQTYNELTKKKNASCETLKESFYFLMKGVKDKDYELLFLFFFLSILKMIVISSPRKRGTLFKKLAQMLSNCFENRIGESARLFNVLKKKTFRSDAIDLVKFLEIYREDKLFEFLIFPKKSSISSEASEPEEIILEGSGHFISKDKIKPSKVLSCDSCFLRENVAPAGNKVPNQTSSAQLHSNYSNLNKNQVPRVANISKLNSVSNGNNVRAGNINKNVNPAAPPVQLHFNHSVSNQNQTPRTISGMNIIKSTSVQSASAANNIRVGQTNKTVRKSPRINQIPANRGNNRNRTANQQVGSNTTIANNPIGKPANGNQIMIKVTSNSLTNVIPNAIVQVSSQNSIQPTAIKLVYSAPYQKGMSNTSTFIIPNNTNIQVPNHNSIQSYNRASVTSNNNAVPVSSQNSIPSLLINPGTGNSSLPYLKTLNGINSNSGVQVSNQNSTQPPTIKMINSSPFLKVLSTAALNSTVQASNHNSTSVTSDEIVGHLVDTSRVANDLQITPASGVCGAYEFIPSSLSNPTVNRVSPNVQPNENPGLAPFTPITTNANNRASVICSSQQNFGQNVDKNVNLNSTSTISRRNNENIMPNTQQCFPNPTIRGPSNFSDSNDSSLRNLLMQMSNRPNYAPNVRNNQPGFYENTVANAEAIHSNVLGTNLKQCTNSMCKKEAILICSGCNKAYYCGTDCQKLDWAYGHNVVCGYM